MVPTADGGPRKQFGNLSEGLSFSFFLFFLFLKFYFLIYIRERESERALMPVGERQRGRERGTLKQTVGGLDPTAPRS